MALVVDDPPARLAGPLSEVTFVVVDVETTGGSPASASLTEVAAARFRGGELLGTYRTFVRPAGVIPPFIVSLTGIDDSMVADAPSAAEILPSLLEFLGDGVLVGHNVRFDKAFLDHALVAAERDPLDNPTVDTLALARRLVRDEVANCKLGTLAAGLRLVHRPSHRALDDVLATGDLLHLLLERAGSYGIVSLDELLVLPRLIGHPLAAKLPLTARLPGRPGVYWFTDATGAVLHVGSAPDLRARVRSYFTSGRRLRPGRLLRQLEAVHHRECRGELTAAVVAGRLDRAWVVRRSTRGGPGRGPRTSSARARSLRAAGRVVLDVEGEGTVVLDGGVLDGGVLEGGVLAGGIDGMTGGAEMGAGDGERALVAGWLDTHAARVRIVSVEAADGWSAPVDPTPSASPARA